MFGNGSRLIALPVLLLASLTLVMTGCQDDVKAPDVPIGVHPGKESIPTDRIRLTSPQEQEIGIQVREAGLVPFRSEIISNGQVEASSVLQAHVFASAQGKAVSVPVLVGQVVRAGQVLTTMKSDVLGQLESDFLQQNIQNELDLKQAIAQVAFSKAGFEREDFLFKHNVSARVDYETARTQYLKDQDAVQSLRYKKEATLDTADRRFALYGVGPRVAHDIVKGRRINPILTLRSPRSGVVILRAVNPGEMIDPSKELFTIADIHQVLLAGNIYEQDVNKVRVGQPIQVKLDSQPDRVFPGRIQFVSQVLDPVSRTLEIRGQVQNPQLALRPNMFARMKVDVGAPRLFAVPSGALQKKGDFTFVYVQVAPHTFEERQVVTGHDNGEYVEILSGLKPSEMVAVRGTMALQGRLIKTRE